MSAQPRMRRSATTPALRGTHGRVGRIRPASASAASNRVGDLQHHVENSGSGGIRALIDGVRSIRREKATEFLQHEEKIMGICKVDAYRSK